MKKTMLIVLALLGLMVQGMSAQTIKSPDGKILVFLELKRSGETLLSCQLPRSGGGKTLCPPS